MNRTSALVHDMQSPSYASRSGMFANSRKKSASSKHKKTGRAAAGFFVFFDKKFRGYRAEPFRTQVQSTLGMCPNIFTRQNSLTRGVLPAPSAEPPPRISKTVKTPGISQNLLT